MSPISYECTNEKFKTVMLLSNPKFKKKKKIKQDICKLLGLQGYVR